MNGPGTTETAGLLRRDGWAVLRVRGEDHVDYLQRMTTQDVAGLAPGRAAYALVLTSKGRILGDPFAWCAESEVLLELDPGARDEMLPVLERYVIADDVTFEDVSERHGVFHLFGPSAPAALETLGVSPLEDLAHAEATIGGATVRVLRRDLGRRPAYTLLVPRADASAVERALLDAPGVRPARPDDLDRVRVLEGIPAYGAELGLDVMPLEANLEDRAISWSKGCYPGQEPVVMARHRGKPPHRLVRFAAEAGSPLEPGRALVHEGRSVGRVTTVVADADGVRGLALLRHALAEAPGDFEVEGGGRISTEPLGS